MIRSGFVFYSMIFCNVLLCRLRAEDSCPSGENSDDSISKTVGFLDFVGNLLDEAQTFQRNDLSEIGDTEEGNLCEPLPMDCKEILLSGRNVSGVYKIWPRKRLPFVGVDVYCDMTTDGGGWTVFQRRGDYGNKNDYFNQDWIAYKKGFGDIEKEFWIGNDLLFSLTKQKSYSLRVDIKDWENKSKYAVFEKFWIGSEDDGYTLHVADYKGNAEDSLTYHSGSKFSTKDRDNDSFPASCAAYYRSGWWFKSCFKSNLNGLYVKFSENHNDTNGISWRTFKSEGLCYSLPFAEMKIRPFSYTSDI